MKHYPGEYHCRGPPFIRKREVGGFNEHRVEHDFRPNSPQTVSTTHILIDCVSSLYVCVVHRSRVKHV